MTSSWSDADHHIIGATRVDVAALEDVTASKEWSNRPKDHEALDELRPSTTTSKRQTRLARAVVASAAPTSTDKESDRGLPAPWDGRRRALGKQFRPAQEVLVRAQNDATERRCHERHGRAHIGM